MSGCRPLTPTLSARRSPHPPLRLVTPIGPAEVGRQHPQHLPPIPPVPPPSMHHLPSLSNITLVGRSLPAGRRVQPPPTHDPLLLSIRSLPSTPDSPPPTRDLTPQRCHSASPLSPASRERRSDAAVVAACRPSDRPPHPSPPLHQQPRPACALAACGSAWPIAPLTARRHGSRTITSRIPGLPAGPRCTSAVRAENRPTNYLYLTGEERIGEPWCGSMRSRRGGPRRSSSVGRDGAAMLPPSLARRWTDRTRHWWASAWR